VNILYTSGSDDAPPEGALLFFEDGSMHLSADECSVEDRASLALVVDFFSYALTRNDWMSSYVDHIKKDHGKFVEEKRAKFKLIQGGLTGSAKL